MSILSWFYSDPENDARGAAAAAQLEQIKNDRIASGYYNAAQAAQVQQSWETDAYLTPAQADAALNDAFDEGWQEGQQNVSTFIGGTLNKVVGSPLKAILGGIPWWVWLALIVGLFFYLGGFTFLRKRFA